MYKVLIVEDDPMVAMINEQFILKNGSFEVCCKCSNGRCALEYLQKNKVDLIVMDVYMPQLNGVEVLHQLRAEGDQTAVIMVTAANDKDTVVEAINLGAVDYLVKPFTMERFQVALNKFLSKADALKNSTKFSQEGIDALIGGSKADSDMLLPKGIQPKTLSVIRDFMKGCDGEWYPGDVISSETGLSVVTIRRYMDYLIKIGEVKSDIDYSTGGRPSVLYKWIA